MCWKGSAPPGWTAQGSHWSSCEWSFGRPDSTGAPEGPQGTLNMDVPSHITSAGFVAGLYRGGAGDEASASQLMARLTGVTTQQQRQQRVQMRALSRQALAKSPDLVAHRLAIEKAAEDAKGKTDVKKGLSIPEFATRDLLLPSVKEILDSSKLLDHLPESKVVDLWDSRAVIRAGNDKFNDRIGASFGEGHRIDLSLIDLDDLEARTCFTQKRILKLFVIYTKVCHGEGDATIDSHQFRLFLKDEPRFRVPKDSTVVQHMFEVFDNDRNGSLTFQELVNGLSFFTQDSQHDESAPRFEDPGFPRCVCSSLISQEPARFLC